MGRVRDNPAAAAVAVLLPPQNRCNANGIEIVEKLLVFAAGKI